MWDIVKGSFNPRPREGGDPGADWRLQRPDVSIRAPVKGAIGDDPGKLPLRRSFNPRPREGGDVFAERQSSVPQAFQSAPP